MRLPTIMLDLFRKRGLTSVVYGVIIVATILVFVIQFRPNAGQKSAPLTQACLATVRGFCIDAKDADARAPRGPFRILIPRDAQGNLMMARAKSMGLRKIVLDGLVERELLVGEAERLGLQVTDDEITDSIYAGYIYVSIPSDNPTAQSSLGVQGGRLYAGFRDQKTKEFDVKIYERSVRGLLGKSTTEFRESQGRELLAAKVRDAIQAPVRVSEAEASEKYLNEKTAATLEAVEVNQDFVARHIAAPSSAEIEAWKKEAGNGATVETALKSRKENDMPVAGHYRHILVKVEPTASARDRGLALAKLSAAADRIRRGETFANVATEVSQDTGSAAKGGGVGDKTDGFVPQFKKAADALKPGEITASAIQTRFGYHLIEKDDPGKAAEIEAKLSSEIAADLIKKGKALEVTKQIAQATLDAMKGGTSPDDAIRAALHRLDGPKAQPPRLPVSTDPGLTNPSDGGVSDAGPSEPASVDMSAETDDDRPTARTTPEVTRTGDPIPGLSSDARDKLLGFTFASKAGATATELYRSNTGFVAVKVKDRKVATLDDFKKDKDSYLQSMVANRQTEAVALFVKRLRESQKSMIHVNETYLQEGGGKDAGSPFDVEEDNAP